MKKGTPLRITLHIVHGLDLKVSLRILVLVNYLLDELRRPKDALSALQSQLVRHTRQHIDAANVLPLLIGEGEEPVDQFRRSGEVDGASIRKETVSVQRIRPHSSRCQSTSWLLPVSEQRPVLLAALLHSSHPSVTAPPPFVIATYQDPRAARTRNSPLRSDQFPYR